MAENMNPFRGPQKPTNEYKKKKKGKIKAKEDKKNVTLNKPFRMPSGSSKKFGVYVKNDKGNVVKVTFGDPNMEIKRDDPERRKSFRARHNCDNPGPKWKARYWSCWQWRAGTKVKAEITQQEADIEYYKMIAESPYLLDIPDAEEDACCEECAAGLDEFTKRDIFVGKKKKKTESGKPGLWENIRKKKERLGKNYKPASPGSPDRPDPAAFKKAQK